jgi:hypothetical protein
MPAAMARIDWPATIARDISSRSAKLNAKRDRRRSRGWIPPVFLKIPWIEGWCRSNN